MSKKPQEIEALLHELQQSLDVMSSGELSLNASIKEYAKAAGLIAACHSRLQEARLQVEEIDAHLAAVEAENEL